MVMFKFGRKQKNRAEQLVIEAEFQSALRDRLATRLQQVERKAIATITENRSSRREREYRVGSAVFESGYETSCRVIDKSYSGLRLEMVDPNACPEEFALTIPTLRFVGIVRKAWQTESQIGVSILRWSDAA